MGQVLVINLRERKGLTSLPSVCWHNNAQLMVVVHNNNWLVTLEWIHIVRGWSSLKLRGVQAHDEETSKNMIKKSIIMCRKPSGIGGAGWRRGLLCYFHWVIELSAQIILTFVADTLAAHGLEEPCASFPDFCNNRQFHVIYCVSSCLCTLLCTHLIVLLT